MPPKRTSGRNGAPREARSGEATSIPARHRRSENGANAVLLRSGEANSYLAPRACLRPVAGGGLRPQPVFVLRSAPAALARGITTRVPAAPGRAPTGAPRALEQKRHIQRGACRQRGFRNAPETSHGESMPKLGKTGRSTVSAPFLRPRVRVGKPSLSAGPSMGSAGTAVVRRLGKG